MFFNHFSKKEVRAILKKVTDEYEAQAALQKNRINELIQQNRELSARVSTLEEEREGVSEAIIHSVEAGKKIEERSERFVQNQLRGLRLLTDRCKTLAGDIKNKYPEVDDIQDFKEFFEQVDELLKSEPHAFDIEAAKAPTADLEELCRELGIEDDGEELKEFVFFDDDE